MTSNNKKSAKSPPKRRVRKTSSSTAKARAKATPQADEASVQVLKRELEERIGSLTEANRQLKRKIFDLYTIFEISRNFNAVLDYLQLLDTFIFTSLAQVGALKAAVYLERNRNDGEYVVAKQKGSGGFPDPSSRFYSGTVLTDYLSKLNRPTSTETLIQEMADGNERKILDRFHPGLAVPLIYQTRLSGILLISDKMSGGKFRNEDIEFLSILGNQISVAIENTRLYEAERLASQQLRSAQQQLVHSERLAALGEMSAKVAHEINNPLGIILNYVQLIRQAKTPDDTEKFSAIVSDEINRIARIVKELLDFHRPSGLKFVKTDIARVMSDVLMLMERQLQSRGVELIKRFDPDCPMIEVSPENLKQVFLNIIINALDVMDKGGVLEVQVAPEEGDVVIRLCDSGPGIPPEIIPRIFEPFFTTKRPGQGTGLGLSVCYGIIKKHSGSISFRNVEKGGCFEIRLPIETSTRTYEYDI